MKRNELIQLRELVNGEVKRRERIEQLLENDLIKEYIELTNSKEIKLDSNNVEEILNQVLSSFSITKTNDIYVCTRAYYIDWNVRYEETNYYSRNVEINSQYAEHRVYIDIESGENIGAIREANGIDREPLISTFEKDNIVLNPYNTWKDGNGYDEVRFDFFETALKDGQAKAKKKILKKYPRM